MKVNYSLRMIEISHEQELAVVEFRSDELENTVEHEHDLTPTVVIGEEPPV